MQLELGRPGQRWWPLGLVQMRLALERGPTKLALELGRKQLKTLAPLVQRVWRTLEQLVRMALMQLKLGRQEQQEHCCLASGREQQQVWWLGQLGPRWRLWCGSWQGSLSRWSGSW